MTWSDALCAAVNEVEHFGGGLRISKFLRDVEQHGCSISVGHGGFSVMLITGDLRTNTPSGSPAFRAIRVPAEGEPWLTVNAPDGVHKEWIPWHPDDWEVALFGKRLDEDD